MKSNNALIVILGTVTLDAVGIGLVMPVLPGLLRDIVHSDSIASHYGVLLALYALMQFLCAPVLGALSDRFGRRPVLLASLLGATIDYAIMATTPVLWIDPLRRTHRGRHHRRHRCGCWRLYRRHHRWGRSGSPLRAHERLFRRGYGGRPRGRGTVGRHLLACTIPCGGGAQRPQPTTGLLPNAGVA